MSKLMMLTLGLVALMLPLHASLLLKPSLLREGFRRFPRSRWCGRILAAAAVAWAAWVLKDLPLGRFDALKSGLIPVTIVFGALVWIYMEELLAPRALGALLLLYPAPLLEAARLHDSPWSVVMSAAAYIMIIKGMALLLSPYLFRRFSEKALATDASCRLAGAGGLALDALLALLALAVY
jgi:uncharacterized protein YjeT (DUF2065 family)